MSKIRKNTQNDYTKIKAGKRPQFKRGNPGKPKGAKNKINRDIKEMILAAAYDKRLNGKEGLVKFAMKNDRNKALFYGWLFKMLPSNVGISGGGEDSEPLRIIYIPVKKEEKKK